MVSSTVTHLQWFDVVAVNTCNRELGGSGEVSSPAYPDNYPPDQLCVWKLTAQKYHTIVIDIIDIDIEYTTDCKFDRLGIYDGRSRRSPLLMTICGPSFNSSEIRSSGWCRISTFHYYLSGLICSVVYMYLRQGHILSWSSKRMPTDLAEVSTLLISRSNDCLPTKLSWSIYSITINITVIIYHTKN